MHGAMHDQSINVDLSSNCITIKGKEIQLPRQEAELAFTLAKEMPRGARYAQIIIALWGSSEGRSPNTHIRVLVCRLRRILKPYGVEIKNMVDVGYRMVLAENAPIQALRHAA